MIEKRNHRPMSRSPWTGVTGDTLVFALASSGTYLAQLEDRPITAVLVYLSGVLIVGARSGMYRGLIAAILASLAFNFFLSEPVFRFGASTLDEIVPLLAFNLSAIFSGALAGKLKDSAKAARAAEAENASLLRLSDKLQKAVGLEDLEQTICEPLSKFGIKDVELYVRRQNGLCRPSLGPGKVDTIADLLPTDEAKPTGPQFQVRELRGTDRELGFVKLTSDRDRDDLLSRDLQPVANLLALAVERCLLLEELSEARAVQRSEELKDAILASVSHDLRTPLTAIEAAASSLASFNTGLSDGERRRMLETIGEQCSRLNRYTSNLIAMGRIQSGIPEKELAETDVVEILGVALGRLREKFPGQPIDKQVSVNSAVVNANGPMLEQAIYNVMENGIVHGPDDVALHIAVSRDEDNVCLSITDSGPGISDHDLPHVFERFYRSNLPAHRRGSGLGLYIARGFIEAFGGRIKVARSSGGEQGASVSIVLPLSERVRNGGETA